MIGIKCKRLLMAKKRSVYSIKNELLKKSQEAALSAIQIFNNPLITFKSESFIVLMNIAWTYLMHAYYKDKGIDYRYYKKAGKRKRFDKTKHKADKHWELERCLDDQQCPLNISTKRNLKFLIGIRHEIEHQMTNKIDDFISAKFQACCLNYNESIKSLFGDRYALDTLSPIALQLFSFQENQIEQLKGIKGLPQNMIDFVSNFEKDLSDNEKLEPQYSYKVIYTRDSVNRENQADIAYRFINEGSEEGREIQNILVKNKKQIKLTQKQVVDEVKSKGFPKFTTSNHQQFWMSKWPSASQRNSSSEAKQFGELIMDSQWLWYKDPWIKELLKHCEENRESYV